MKLDPLPYATPATRLSRPSHAAGWASVLIAVATGGHWAFPHLYPSFAVTILLWVAVPTGIIIALAEVAASGGRSVPAWLGFLFNAAAVAYFWMHLRV